MRLNRFIYNFFCFFIIASTAAPFAMSVYSLQNPQNINHLVVSAKENITKVTLEVICDEDTGFCELNKTLSDEKSDEKKLLSTPTPIQENIYYQKFVETFHLCFAFDDAVQSYIKIKDTPPPIFA